MEFLELDTGQIEKEYLENASFIGVMCAEEGYRFCWLINKYLNYNFIRHTEYTISFDKTLNRKATTRYNKKNADIVVQQNTDNYYFFPIYIYSLVGNEFKYLIYKLKDKEGLLFQSIKHLDYLIKIEDINPALEANKIMQQLRKIPEIQLVLILNPDELENIYELSV